MDHQANPTLLALPVTSAGIACRVSRGIALHTLQWLPAIFCFALLVVPALTQHDAAFAESASKTSGKTTDTTSAKADHQTTDNADNTINADHADDVDAPEVDATDKRANKPQRRGRKAGNNSAKNNELREEDMPEALAVLHDYRPELVKRFEDWAQRHPEQARTMLSRSVPMMTRLIRMRRDDPAGYRLAIDDLRYYRYTAELSNQLRAARTSNDDTQIQELSIKLRTLLIRHFEVRQKIRERDIQRLEQRIEQLRKQLDHRAQAREKILDSRFKQLSDPSEKSPW